MTRENHGASRDGELEWQPSVGFGLTLIASAAVLFLSVARPESQVKLSAPLPQPVRLVAHKY